MPIASVRLLKSESLYVQDSTFKTFKTDKMKTRKGRQAQPQRVTSSGSNNTADYSGPCRNVEGIQEDLLELSRMRFHDSSVREVALDIGPPLESEVETRGVKRGNWDGLALAARIIKKFREVDLARKSRETREA